MAYEEAEKIQNLHPCNPIKLGMALSNAVWTYEVLKDHGSAYDIADKALKSTFDKIDEIDGDQ